MRPTVFKGEKRTANSANLIAKTRNTFVTCRILYQMGLRSTPKLNHTQLKQKRDLFCDPERAQKKGCEMRSRELDSCEREKFSKGGGHDRKSAEERTLLEGAKKCRD